MLDQPSHHTTTWFVCLIRCCNRHAHFSCEGTIRISGSETTTTWFFQWLGWLMKYLDDNFAVMDYIVMVHNFLERLDDVKFTWIQSSEMPMYFFFFNQNICILHIYVEDEY